MLRLTREQIRRVDRIAIEKYHVPAVVLMENAARGVVDVATAMLDRQRDGNVLILCGGGNNGGDGLAVARHMHNRRAVVHVLVLGDPGRYQHEARTNWDIVQAMGISCELIRPDAIWRERPVLIVDALFGTGLTTPPREPVPLIVEAVKRSGAPVLSVDLPSGLDCNTGSTLGAACIRADRTVTFVAEKAGFVAASAKPYLGQVSVADIGCPAACIAEAVRQVAGEATIPPA